MSERQFSLQTYFEALCAEHRPKLAFANSGMAFSAWKQAAREKLDHLCGFWPEAVPLRAEITQTCEMDGYTRHRVVFDSERNLSVPCWLLLPHRQGPLPAILCSHGHDAGNFGKDLVAGVALTQAQKAEMAAMNCNYAEQMAKAGFVTLVPDLRAFGERGAEIGMVSGHDGCDMHYLKASLLGMYPLTLNVWDMMRCIDFLETLPQVDASRIGMMGLSQGGTITTFTTALDPRIRAADIIGYVNPLAGFAMSRGNFCGSQVLPQLLCWFDTCDIAGLIAPRPLLL